MTPLGDPPLFLGFLHGVNFFWTTKAMLMPLIIVSIILLIIFSVPAVHAVPLSDMPGLKFTFPVKTDGHSFVIEATGNLDITNLDFDKEKKRISLGLKQLSKDPWDGAEKRYTENRKTTCI